MRALIMGGTGAIGSELAHILLKQDWQVSVTSRSSHRNSNRITIIRGDAKDASFLGPLLEESWDIIIDCMIYSTKEFHERADALLRNTGQYIYLSSARVYAESDEPLTETSNRLLDVSKDPEFLATDEYALAKARQEDILARSKSRNWTIVRPYITYGPARLQLGVLEKEEWLYRACRGRTIVVSEEINSRLTTMTHARDVALGIAALGGDDRALGEVYQITSPASISWKRVMSVYSEVLSEWLGVDLKILELDTSAFQAINPRKYQIMYDRLYDRVFDSKKIREHTDTSKFTKPETGLKEALLQCLQERAFLSINWPVEAKKDWLTGEVASFNEIKDLKVYAAYLSQRYLHARSQKISTRKTV
jgi:nucleoside-diphosphate-sugar epimerase